MKCERCKLSGRVPSFAGTMLCPKCDGRPRLSRLRIQEIIDRLDQGLTPASQVRERLGIPR